LTLVQPALNFNQGPYVTFCKSIIYNFLVFTEYRQKNSYH